ncbi:MAG: hypothetical protein E6K73_13205, partial [Candidatus Eisenbacteria bacterium]
MTEMLDLRGGLRHALEESGEPGAAELYDFLQELLDGDDPADRVHSLRRLKARVFRLEIAGETPWRSIVLKRLALSRAAEPADRRALAAGPRVKGPLCALARHGGRSARRVRVAR